MLARHLSPLGTPFYLPLAEHRVRRSGRQFVSWLPLFAGYVFMRADAAARADIWRSGVVVNLIEVRDQDLLSRELTQLHELEQSGASLKPEPVFAAGDFVRITEGPFRNYFGTIVQERGRSRLVVSVTMLQRSVSVEMDREVLTPAKKAALAGRAMPAGRTRRTV
jgi:transcription antitermination factor NusG